MRSIILVIGILLAATSATTPAHSGNVYDRSGKYLGSTVRNADGSTSNTIGERSIGTRSGYQSYNSSGQMNRYGIWQVHGRVMRNYSADGRYLGLTVKRGGTITTYDASGRLKATGQR